ncbi:MAG: hypothetical protein KGI68_10310 [Alphaproteobacteria bacterium]|nr:hypothetical protein [Alphaproteobacteria bacterium]MDE2163483.1 hypothetical protein [Alphaproteobacteria bacterium]MDE2500028.1 hypothetical protein [Alphaproteobacteria bacterium]
MKKYAKPQAYAAETKDHRYAGTFEVLVPLPDRVKPHRIAQQFPTMQAAEGWLHSDEGQDAIAELFASHTPAPAKAGNGKAAKR